MDLRSKKWSECGMIVEDMTGLSLAEKHTFVTKENVWGNCAWSEWVNKGYSPEDLYYVWRIYELIPEEVYFDGYPAYKDIADSVYEDYITQINAIKEYLLEQVKAGTLNKSKWLEQLYISKGWGFVRHMHGQNNEFVFDQDIFYDCVVTQSMLQFIDKFRYRVNVNQFHIEYLCQNFPVYFSLENRNPRVTERFVGVDCFEYTVAVPNFKMVKNYKNKQEFLAEMEKGVFRDGYMNWLKENNKVTYNNIIDVTPDNSVVQSTQPTNEYKLLGYRYARGSYRKLFIIEDSVGGKAEMTETALRELMSEDKVVIGVAISESGSLIFPNGITKI